MKISPRNLQTLLIAASSLLAVSCGRALFSPPPAEKQASAPVASPTSTPVAQDAAKSEVASAEVKVEQTVIPSGRALIIDLKSGWWSGDGGDLMEKYVAQTVIRSKKVGEVHYIHLTASSSITRLSISQAHGTNKTILNPTTFKDWLREEMKRDFDQIWILSGFSGSEFGTLSTSEFLPYQLILGPSKGNLFLGAGVGANTHANYLVQEWLGGRFTFTCHLESCGGAGTESLVVSKFSKESQQLANHPLFANMTSLPNETARSEEFLVPMKSNRIDAYLSSEIHNFQFLTPDQSLATFTYGASSRKVVLEGGMQRFFALRDSSAQVDLYLLNLLDYLMN